MGMVDIRGVDKSYDDVKVIHDVNLSFAPGDFVVILGPSGCGKSTLLRMIAGLEKISGGEISIDGRVINDVEPRNRGIAMVFQNYALYPHMSVRENLSYGLKLAKAKKTEIEAKVKEVASILGLDTLLERRPGQLSGGQRQRVAMGRAIIREPKVFLFDEPLSNLDAKLRNQMRMELKRLHMRLNATSVLVTHDQIEAMSLATQLVLMNAGVVEQVGSPSEVYNQPRTLFTAGFVGSLPMNFFAGKVVEGGSRLHLDNGVEIPLTRRLAAYAESSIVLGVRPDAFRLVSDAHHGVGVFQAKLDLSEDLGGTRLLHATSSGGGQFSVAVAPDVEVGAADIHARVSERDLHIFDAATQCRI
ncbi:ABC transporter ATP-binding protein [Candidimonas nitroreducens]|uniref:sn-glycerol-3-phosphate ABC transporter ATP-binding protein UgpC n=1 Tax=Candidimonas nitroreducens TaxID=683354 RepID=A0A225MBC2_9BURK|nr:sn-glycerol-3-phosphate ABC transporter ATP-binding protein UgpC [Candidimonas nitroreducens]OWT57440.1 sn-glycerol-3-phosphate ABC transporter ATP-binding protein UgpC [Candidimonas nitroreducens]